MLPRFDEHRRGHVDADHVLGLRGEGNEQPSNPGAKSRARRGPKGSVEVAADGVEHPANVDLARMEEGGQGLGSEPAPVQRLIGEHGVVGILLAPLLPGPIGAEG